MSKKAKAKIQELKHLAGNIGDHELHGFLVKKSAAAANLFNWAWNTNRYYDIFCVVEPKMKLVKNLQKAQE